MRLQLDSSALKSADASPAVAAGGARSGTARLPDGGGQGDSIGISGPSSALNRITAERASRIQQLGDAVRSGQYRISSAAVGAAILAQARG